MQVVSGVTIVSGGLFARNFPALAETLPNKKLHNNNLGLSMYAYNQSEAIAGCLASSVTPSAFGDAWGSATTSLSDAYGDGGSYTTAYDASTFKWSLTGHLKKFDGVHVMAKTMNLPNSFFVAVEFHIVS